MIDLDNMYKKWKPEFWDQTDMEWGLAQPPAIFSFLSINVSSFKKIKKQ